MPVNRIPEFDYLLAEYISNTRRRFGIDPNFLGGVEGPAGGTGSPPGGFVGQLVQTQVTYDTTEAAVYTTSGSSSLLDNLNHIRYRLESLEERIWMGL